MENYEIIKKQNVKINLYKNRYSTKEKSVERKKRKEINKSFVKSLNENKDISFYCINK